mgnify:CR=1 FL=1
MRKKSVRSRSILDEVTDLFAFVTTIVTRPIMLPEKPRERYPLTYCERFYTLLGAVIPTKLPNKNTEKIKMARV